ncbi:hypothetical protein [Pontibacillus marinus]|uniref:Uncharacterized protein n=1 Tax=Pontibacillus marinus BH030004 = DSM 16465 TaxID=1385511 RepID=A0A0A5GAJ7_9BACI|nr:hypothetical protein [Pontibacillus marinus]KGX90201.1 hypothetical protein N783_01530 [Pontibacillus marinus BH030004 = DSM 16465]
MSTKLIYRIIVFILVVTLVIIGNMYRKERVENEENYEDFLNDLHFNLYHAIDYAETIQEKKPKGDSLDDFLHGFEGKMMRLYYLVGFSRSYVDLNVPKHFFYQSPKIILEGFYIQEEINKKRIPPFNQDGKLDKEELLILETMTGYMKQVKRGIEVSSNKVNTELPKDKLEQLIFKQVSHNYPKTYFDAINK